jgi:enterochelin esterase-like enzyme
MKFPSLASLATLLALSSFAQAPSTNAPARRNFTPPIISPQIAADHMVTFRVRAAKASEVAVQGQWKNGRSSMSKSNDVWSVTVGPIDAGVWEYSLNIDGVSMIDPANTWIKPMREPRTSILHIPGDPPKLWDFQDVPHGTVNFQSYHSKAVGKVREMAVYTPPGYYNTRAEYPLIVLQHGSGDNQATWTVHGKAHWILDNLIAKKEAVPMVVVMLDGHAATGGGAGGSGLNNNTQLFEKDLLEDVLAIVEKTYRVKKGAKNRGIVGLSMGGGQSLTIGLNHNDQFGWVGGFSSAVPNKETVDKNIEAAKKLKLLWIGVGKDDFLLQRNNEFDAYLKEKSVPHEYVITEGNHSWPVWRDYLTRFAPKLFR